MQQILKNAICNPAAGRAEIHSYILNARKARTASIQMIAKAIDTTRAGQSVGWLQGSNDSIVWTNIAYLTTSGNNIQIDGGPFETLWEVIRFRLESTVNCAVDVYLVQREG